MKEIIAVFGISLCFFNVKAQDTLWLKSGKTIAGQIVSFADNIVRIKAGQDMAIYRLDEIKSLRYNNSVKKSNTAAPVKTSKTGSDKKQEDEIEVKPVKGTK